MKYEFNVGDYVETRNGAKGYVKDPKNLWWVCTVAANGYTPGFAYSIIGLSNNGMSEFFNRIGQYDFTKSESPKEIGKLTPHSWRMGTSGDDLISKINELVDAVNELKRSST